MPASRQDMILTLLLHLDVLAEDSNFYFWARPDLGASQHDSQDGPDHRPVDSGLEGQKQRRSHPAIVLSGPRILGETQTDTVSPRVIRIDETRLVLLSVIIYRWPE